MTEPDVRSGTMATKGVEVPTADEDDLRYTERGGASGQCANVVPFGYVMYDDVAFEPHFEFNGDEMIEEKVMGFTD